MIIRQDNLRHINAGVMRITGRDDYSVAIEVEGLNQDGKTVTFQLAFTLEEVAALAPPPSAIVPPAPGTIVTHVTKAGKTLTGTIHPATLSHDEAKAFDPYTFRKCGGWFVRCSAAPATGAAADATRSLIQVLKSDDA